MRIPNWFRVDSDNGVRFYQAWNLHASGMVAHGFSTRLGGHSTGSFESLNLGLAVEDVRDAVIANRQVFAEAIGMQPDHIVVPQQVHSERVAVVTKAELGMGSLDHVHAVPDTDALITNVPGVPLALHFADCTCIMLLDPVCKAIGVVHAGWRGTVSRIVVNTVEAMAREYGSDPNNILAAIGPSVCRNCYDVGADTARQLFQTFPFDERVIKQSSSTKWRADLKTANQILLRDCGLQDSNIAVSESCTCCDADEFFSYRRDGNTGRMGGWMSLL